MKKLHLALVTAFCSFGYSSLMGLTANINWGSFPSTGGALFQGSDGGSADSIALGYFTGSANGELTGWQAINVDNSFNTTAGFNIGDAGSYDVTAANGNEAWILLTDGLLSGLVSANDWVSYSGADAPAPIPTLNFQLDSSDSDSTVSTLAGSGSLINIINNGGQGGSGIAVQLTAVPEPSAFAFLAGCFGFAWVMVRRRA